MSFRWFQFPLTSTVSFCPGGFHLLTFPKRHNDPFYSFPESEGIETSSKNDAKIWTGNILEWWFQMVLVV